MTNPTLDVDEDESLKRLDVDLFLAQAAKFIAALSFEMKNNRPYYTPVVHAVNESQGTFFKDDLYALPPFMRGNEIASRILGIEDTEDAILDTFDKQRFSKGEQPANQIVNLGVDMYKKSTADFDILDKTIKRYTHFDLYFMHTLENRGVFPYVRDVMQEHVPDDRFTQHWTDVVR